MTGLYLYCTLRLTGWAGTVGVLGGVSSTLLVVVIVGVDVVLLVVISLVGYSNKLLTSFSVLLLCRGVSRCFSVALLLGVWLYMELLVI